MTFHAYTGSMKLNFRHLISEHEASSRLVALILSGLRCLRDVNSNAFYLSNEHFKGNYVVSSSY